MLKLSLKNSKIQICESKTDFIIVHARTHVLKSTTCHLVVSAKKQTNQKKKPNKKNQQPSSFELLSTHSILLGL